MAGNSGEPGRTVTSKLAAILTAFTTGRDHTLSELAMLTDLPVSTVHRLLNDLVRTRLLERVDGCTYRPGPTLRDLPSGVRRPTLRARAPFVVEDLATSLDATARLGVVDGLEVAYVEKSRSRPGTLFPNPARLPLHASAMGIALLAFGPRWLVRLVSGGDLQRFTPRTVTCRTRLEHALVRTRARGVALTDRELHLGSSAVAAPVFDTRGRAIAAIEVNVAGPGREAVERVVPALLTAARCLHRELAPRGQLGRPAEPRSHPAGAPHPLRMWA